VTSTAPFSHEALVRIEAVERVLDERLRPALNPHLGNIAITDADEGHVELQLLGSCRHCPFRRACEEEVVRPVLESEFGDSTRFTIARSTGRLTG
jgi:Fe-S cluster biogenesis protein NfuA